MAKHIFSTEDEGLAAALVTYGLQYKVVRIKKDRVSFQFEDPGVDTLVDKYYTDRLYAYYKNLGMIKGRRLTELRKKYRV